MEVNKGRSANKDKQPVRKLTRQPLIGGPCKKSPRVYKKFKGRIPEAISKWKNQRMELRPLSGMAENKEALSIDMDYFKKLKDELDKAETDNI